MGNHTREEETCRETEAETEKGRVGKTREREKKIDRGRGKDTERQKHRDLLQKARISMKRFIKG